MKQKIILAALAVMLSVCAKQTAYSQSTDSVTTVASKKYDSLLMVAVQGLAAQEAFDTLQKWHRKIWLEYVDLLAENQKLWIADSLARDYEKNMLGIVQQAQNERDDFKMKYQNEFNRKRKAWGIGLSVGYNPFTNRPYAGVGLTWNIVRFSLRGATDNSVEYGGGSGGGGGATGSFTDKLRTGY